MKAIRMILAAATVLSSGLLLAQEHPSAAPSTSTEHPKAAPATNAAEHPKAAPATKAAEHPEHPKAKPKEVATSAKKYSIDELETAIKRDVAQKEKANGGYLKVKDPVTKKSWLLKLDHVHRERLSQLDAHTYFACSDFKSKDGHLVDVDFFEKEKNGALQMSDMTIHKVDGKARYGWQEQNGFWKRVPVVK